MAIFSVTSAADTGWENKHTNYAMLLHSTAYVLRFLHNLKAATQGQPGRKTQGLSVAEVEAAELLLFKRSQARIIGQRSAGCQQMYHLLWKKDQNLDWYTPTSTTRGFWQLEAD